MFLDILPRKFNQRISKKEVVMPFKNEEKQKEYFKEWRRINKDIICLKAKIYYDKNKSEILLKKKEYWKENNSERNLYQKELRIKYPWRSHYFSAKNRCTNKNGKNYNTYGGRGIKFELTLNEIKELWYRDNAGNMKRATIDRIDNNKNYRFENCRFMEGSENATKGNYESRWK